MRDLIVIAIACPVRFVRSSWRSGGSERALTALQCCALFFLTIAASSKILAQTNAGSAAATRYIEALQKGDFRTVIDLSYGYQAEIAQIKAQNPQVLWPKLTNQYYSAKIDALSKKPDASGTYLATFLQGMTGDPAQQIQFMQNMVLPNAKWKVTETRTEHVQDQFDGHEYDRTVVYITVTFPTLNDSPFVDGEFLKETILEVDLNAKLQQIMRVGRVAQGDTPWEAPVTIMNAKWQREGLVGMGGLSAEAFGGKAPYTWKPVCGPYDLSNSIINQPTNQQVPASLVVNLQRFPTNVAFPLHCALTVTDGKGQSDTVGITVPQMLSGVSEFCYVREPWFSRGQGRPQQSNMCLNPLRATDTASASNSSTTLVPPSPEGPPSTPGADQGNAYGGSTPSAACNGYADCFKAGIKSYEAANETEATADFQAASEADPKQGQAWYWQGIVMLKGHQITQVEQLARVWDKALSLGSIIAISVCHERGIQPCERGSLMLSQKFVSFPQGNTQALNVPPQQTEPGRILNNAAFAHVTYSLKTGGKNYTFDFVPSTWQTCKFDLMVQCPQSGFAEQLILAQYVAQTLPKLASGAFTIIASGGSAQRGPTGTDQTAPTTPTLVTTPSQTNALVPKIAVDSSEVKPTITEFDLPTSLFPPSAITTGPDGSLWFTAGNKIGRITTAGGVTGYEVPTAKSGVMGITLGPDGAVWFVETSANKIGRITAAGTIKEFPLPSQDVPTEIASGSDGALWFTASAAAKIGRITTSGSITEYPLPVPYSQPSDITAGPDGALWFTENSAKKIGRISVAGAIREFSVPSSNGYPTGIASGPDRALWFTEPQGGKIGRITTEGVITEYHLHADNTNPLGIALGPDGALWFTDNAANKIGRITTGGNITEYDLPTFTSNPGMGITKGPDNALWFTESGKIGRVNPAGKPSGSGAPK